jgi:hypothetical protein
LTFFTPGLTPERHPTRLPDTVRRTAGTGADFHLFLADEAPGPADDARTT